MTMPHITKSVDGSLSYKSILYESPQFIWTCGSPWLRAEGMLLVLKVYETCDLTICPARDIFLTLCIYYT